MSKFTRKWIEHHEFSCEAESQQEFDAICDATDSDVTRMKTVHIEQHEYCESHGQEINEDNPCFSCAREIAEERRYDESRES